MAQMSTKDDPTAVLTASIKCSMELLGWAIRKEERVNTNLHVPPLLRLFRLQAWPCALGLCYYYQPALPATAFEDEATITISPNRTIMRAASPELPGHGGEDVPTAARN